MLVLSRKTNQSIMIGDNIEVVIVECKDGSVKIGIEAPKNIKVFRKEIFDEIKNENSEALVTDIDMLKKALGDKKQEGVIDE